jgi:hypothetical protein
MVSSSVAFSRRKRRLLGHYGSSAQHVEELVILARHHRLNLRKSVSGHIPLSDAQEAVRRLAGGADSQVRLVLCP